jgi:hypothetical protein
MAKEKEKEVRFEGITEPKEVGFVELCEKLEIPQLVKSVLIKALPDRVIIAPPTFAKDALTFAISYIVNDDVEVTGKLKIKHIGKENCEVVLSTKGCKIETTDGTDKK